MWQHQLVKKASHLQALAQQVEAEMITAKETLKRNLPVEDTGLDEATRQRRAKIAEAARAKRAAQPQTRRKTVVKLGPDAVA